MGVNRLSRFIPAATQMLAELGWSVRPALVVLAGAAIAWQGRADFPNWRSWRSLPFQSEIAILRSKLIGESQLTRLVFSKITELGGLTAAEKGATPTNVVAQISGEHARSGGVLKEQLDAESAAVLRFLEAISQHCATDTVSADALATLRCEAFTRLGDIEIIAGRDPEALKHYQAALAIATEAKAPLAWCDAAQNLQQALTLKGRHAESQLLARQLVELRTTHQGLTNLETINSLNTLALACEARGDTTGAEPLFAKVLALQSRLLGNKHPDTLQCLSRLAAILKSKGEFIRAIPLYRRLLIERAQTLGSEHPKTLKNMNDLAVLLWLENDRASSKTLYWRGLESAEFAGHEARHRDYLEITMAGRETGYAEAEALFRRGLEASERSLGKDHEGTLMNLTNLGDFLAARGKPYEASLLLERALAGLEKIAPRNSRTLMGLMETVSRLREKQGHLSEALPLAEELVVRIRETQPEGTRERELFEKWLGGLRDRALRSQQERAAANAAGRSASTDLQTM